MKQLNEINIPDNCKYSDNHEWVRKKDLNVSIGISDYAQDQLGDVVYVELPEVGTSFEKNVSFGVVESVKSVSELLMPVSGEVVNVNTLLNDSPDTVNNDPYNSGWIIEVKPHNPDEMDNLMSAEEYLNMLKGKE